VDMTGCVCLSSANIYCLMIGISKVILFTQRIFDYTLVDLDKQRNIRHKIHEVKNTLPVSVEFAEYLKKQQHKNHSLFEYLVCTMSY